jgi:hypothetical protein
VGSTYGVDGGDLTITNGETVNITGGTLVFNQGKNIYIPAAGVQGVSGQIVMNTGASIQKAYIYYLDADHDGYASTTAGLPIVATSSDPGTNGYLTINGSQYRRGNLAGAPDPYVSGDCLDTNAAVNPGTTTPVARPVNSDYFTAIYTKAMFQQNCISANGNYSDVISEPCKWKPGCYIPGPGITWCYYDDPKRFADYNDLCTQRGGGYYNGCCQNNATVRCDQSHNTFICDFVTGL